MNYMAADRKETVYSFITQSSIYSLIICNINATMVIYVI